MNKIAGAFSHGKAFIAFITCGDPDLGTTAECVRAAVDGGADLIELGIPFSDPTAEGPVIQSANARALAGGVTTDKIFAMVKELRRDVSVPMVFMTYVDGMILPDVPFEEKEEFAPACRERGLSFISLIAPTSENRVAMIAREAEGFLYIVSSMGVTGVRSEITTDIGAMVELVRKSTSIPCAVGFGISTPEQAAKMAGLSDGAIVGSAIVRLIHESGPDAPNAVREYVSYMTRGLGRE